MKNILIVEKEFRNQEYEFVERKGWGHPDSLADGLAEKLSREYSRYTLDKYGAILHHNFDKVGVLGGSSFVTFGKGHLVKPIRVLINGRVSTKFSNKEIPFKNLLMRWTKEYFANRLPLVNVNENLEYHFNLSNQSSPGKTNEAKAEKGTRKYWFEPRGLFDLQELKRLVSNDTSLGVGYAPRSNLELALLNIEDTLSSDKYKERNRWIGSDIKMMGFRLKDKISITMCVPQIAKYVPSLEDYKSNIAKAKRIFTERVAFAMSKI